MAFEWDFHAEGAAAILDTYFGENAARLERAFLKGTARSAARFVAELGSDMNGAGLGGLSRAIGSRSDEQKGGIQRRYPQNGFSASAQAYVRSKSERSRGALQSYLRGSDIDPVRSRWLWIPTENIPRVSKRYRLTPAMWKVNGLDKRIGPLFRIKSINGYPLLAVQNVGIDLSGKSRSVKGLTKRGTARKGQVKKELIICFIGIPRTSRSARVNPDIIFAKVMSDLPQTIANFYGKA